MQSIKQLRLLESEITAWSSSSFWQTVRVTIETRRSTFVKFLPGPKFKSKRNQKGKVLPVFRRNLSKFYWSVHLQQVIEVTAGALGKWNHDDGKRWAYHDQRQSIFLSFCYERYRVCKRDDAVKWHLSNVFRRGKTRLAHCSRQFDWVLLCALLSSW